MSWTNFLIVILIVYLVYYALNLLFDLLISPNTGSQGEIAEDELFFSQTFSPELISLEEKMETATTGSDKADDTRPASIISPGPIGSSGGVGLKQLFSLAKDNLIEHTRAIPY